MRGKLCAHRLLGDSKAISQRGPVAVLPVNELVLVHPFSYSRDLVLIHRPVRPLNLKLFSFPFSSGVRRYSKLNYASSMLD
jgi:hypothetical protein